MGLMDVLGIGERKVMRKIEALRKAWEETPRESRNALLEQAEEIRDYVASRIPIFKVHITPKFAEAVYDLLAAAIPAMVGGAIDLEKLLTEASGAFPELSPYIRQLLRD